MPVIHLDQLPYNPAEIYNSPLIELTQSSVTTFMSCPQKFVFQYLLRIRRSGISLPLIVGKAVHKGLEIINAAGRDPQENPYAVRIPMALNAVDDIFETILETKPELCLGLEDRLEHGRAQAHAILRSWWIVYGDVMNEWNMLHKELVVRTSPGVTHQSALLDRMGGMIDGVILDQEGKCWILEHKTRRSLMGLNISSLSLDAQALWYMLLCHMILTRQGISLLPQGFLYDTMAKPQHRLSANGFNDLVERMHSAMVATPDKYFSMIPISVEKSTLDHALYNFRKIVRHMDNLSPDTVYKNLKACDDYGGCPYKPLCQQHADVADPLSIFKFPELSMYEITDIHVELEEGRTGADEEEKWTPGFS